MTIDNLKLVLWITDSDSDVLLTFFMDSALVSIEAYLWRSLLANDYVEVHNWNAQRRIIVGQYPINTITSIEKNTWTHDVPVWEPTSPELYTFETNTWIIHITDYLERWFNNYKISYNAGYSTIPKDIEMVAIKMASKEYNTRNSQGVKSESVNGDRIEFIWNTWNNDPLSSLSKYKSR